MDSGSGTSVYGTRVHRRLGFAPRRLMYVKRSAMNDMVTDQVDAVDQYVSGFQVASFFLVLA